MRRFLIIVLILNFTIAFAQHDLKQNNDVKVGLVLSGGGAKGFAHVGVLKIMEEAGVRVDYIAGTSMGSIIGALYASGYNANELDSILKANDFSALLQDKLPRGASSFYQKENSGKYAISLPVNKWKVGLPSAISKGQNVFNLLSQLTEHVHEIEDFSKLPIPFFCIATDLETGEEVVLDHGFLPEAIRASGSFPGLLAPVKIDGKLLIDGGLVDNYPIEKLKEKGEVDYIIGVDVQGELLQEDGLDNVPIILMQIAGFQMYKNIDEKIKMTDLYLKPDIKRYHDFSFEDESDIVQKGVEISKEHFAELKEIASKQSNKKFHNTINTFDVKSELIIKEIEITGNKHYTDSYCIEKLKITKGEPISHDKFVKGINALTATGNFENILYRFVKVEGGLKVEFELIENEVSSFLQFGAHYDDLYKTGILINFTKKHPFLKNDFLSADFVFGDNLRYHIDYFLENGFNWSFGISTRYNSFNEDISIGNIPSRAETELGFKVPVDYNDFTTRLYVQTTISNNLALRLGAEHKYLKVFTEEIVDNNLEKYHFDKSNYFNLFGKATFDSYD
ncbi:MAG: patatin-like phospholipase family protein, partial [Flavobacteriaceae bacterium]|nr:patatin-like phospholipase family protein [Flavobacteriaceae bacterium]